MSLRLAEVSLLAALAAGCGADEPLADLPYDEPADFDGTDCDPASLAGHDPRGIWHLDVHVEGFSPFPGVFRVDVDGEVSARIGALEASARLDAGGWLLRAETPQSRTKVRALLACRASGDGAIDGRIAYCSRTQCTEGGFSGVRVERIAGEADASGLRLLSEYAGEADAPWPGGVSAPLAISVNVRVRDGIAYVARYNDGLRIVDVSEPAAPREIGHAPVADEQGEIYNDVKLVDDAQGRRFALVASDERGVVAIDVSDPERPVEQARFPPAVDPRFGEDALDVHTLFITDWDGRQLAWLADVRRAGLGIWDVTDPASPVELGEFVHPDVAADADAYLHDLYVADGIAYLAYWGLGLVVVDARDPAAPVEIGRFADYERRTSHSVWVTSTGGRMIAVHGDEDFGAHLRVIDVDPESPQFMQQLGELSLRPEVSIHNVMAFGSEAFVAWYQDGVRIVDLADPTAPSVGAWYHTWSGRDGIAFYEGAVGIDVDLERGLVYVADTEHGLLVLER